jgi:hypothetical protein
MEAMGFDFYDAEANMAPAAVDLTARITAPGVWNAVAFWFELQLDEETRLDSSPYCDKVHAGLERHANGQTADVVDSRLNDRRIIMSLCYRRVVAGLHVSGSCAQVPAHYVKHSFGCDPMCQAGRHMAASGAVDGGAKGGARYAAAADSKPRHLWHLLQPRRPRSSSRARGR